MANISAAQNGNFNAGATWTGGVVPGPGDSAFANGKTVTITANVTCTLISTAADAGSGAAAGGGFNINTGVTLTADVTAGTTTCVTLNSGSATITGNVTAGSAANAHGAVNSSTGTLTISGNVTGGSNTNTFGAQNQAAGTLTINGNATGGSGNSSYGAYNNAAGTLTINGNATGGSNATGYGAYNNSTGTLTVTGMAIGNDWGNGSVGIGATVGVNNNSTGKCFVGGIRYGLRGQTPTGGAIFITPAVTNTAVFILDGGTVKTLSDPAGDVGYPTAANVRLGTSYALGNRTGTLAVPAPGSVALGVATDNTVGTAVLTSANAESAATAALSAYGASKPGDAMTLTSGERTTLRDGFWNALTSGLTTVSSIGKLLVDNINATISSRSTYAGGAVASVTAPVSVGSIADGAITANAIATDAITSAKIAADAIGASELAADAVAEIQSGLASQSSVNTVAGYIDTEVAAIKAKTDLLTFDGSAVNASVDIEAFVDPVVEGVVAGVSELAGTGARTVTVTVTDGSDPVEGARVRLTQGAETYIATTDAGGEAVLYVDDGTWTYAAAAALFSGDSGTIVVNGDETLAITLTVITIAAPDDLNQINGYVYTRDAQGDLAGAVSLTFQLVTPLTTAGNSYGRLLTVTSNNSGLLTVPLLRGATYQVQRGYGEIVTVTVPTDGASFALPVTLGDAA